MKLRRSIALIFGMLMMFTLVAPAAAGRTWCRTDPLLIVDGQVVDIQVASELAMLTSANGPIQMVVTVPDGTNAQVVLQDLGFGYGFDIDIVESSTIDPDILAEVAILAPANDSTLPVTVYGTRITIQLPLPDIWTGEASGSANDWIILEVQ